MKIFICICAILILGAFESPASINRDDNQAKLIIYRNKQYVGSLSNFKILVNDVEICKLSNNRYIEYPVDPGKIVISGKIGLTINKKENYEIDADPNGTYYIMVNFKQTLVSAHIIFTEVTERSALADIKEMKKDDCQAQAN